MFRIPDSHSAVPDSQSVVPDSQPAVPDSQLITDGLKYRFAISNFNHKYVYGGWNMCFRLKRISNEK